VLLPAIVQGTEASIQSKLRCFPSTASIYILAKFLQIPTQQYLVVTERLSVYRKKHLFAQIGLVQSQDEIISGS
jgi:hypothetical protein